MSFTQAPNHADQSKRDRIASAVAVIVLHLGIGYMLLAGFGIDVVETTRSVLKVSNITAPEPPPPPPAPKVEQVKQEKPTGKASAKNIKSKASPKEAPKPKVLIRDKKAVTTATKAGSGNDQTAGNSNQAGPGTGAGGQGDGTGAGGRGDGGGSAIASRAEYQSGKISNKDYPRNAAKAKVGGTVTAYFTVLASGNVTNCTIKKSSGNAELDATTCRLIEQRFRYKPARNKNGEPIDDRTGWQQTWWLETGGGKRVTE